MKILVTGSTSGIGRALSESFLKRGDKVIGVARDHDKFDFKNGDYIDYKIDLSDIKNSQESFHNIAKAHTDIDIVIINAGYGDFKELEQFSDVQVLNLFNVNLVSQILLVKALLPNLKKNDQAKIIFIGSESALEGAKKASIYSATKFGLRGFAQSLRRECASNNIVVSMINPGMVKSDFYQKQNFEPGESKENYIAPSQIVNLVELILSLDNNMNLDEVNLSPMKKVIKFKDRV